MDIIGNEVTQRIRGAITNKLKEVGVYVDDELPDYIMVMVANKKSKEQMMSDLQLFLGTNTKTFTVWLHELLDNLQATTSVGTIKPMPVVEARAEELPPSPDPKPSPEEKSISPLLTQVDEDAEEVLTFQTELETEDFLMQELEKEDLLSETQKAVEKKSNKISLKTVAKSPERIAAPFKAAVKVRPIFHRKNFQSPIQRPAKEYDSYLSNDEDEEGDDKYDPRNPSVNSVASVVRVSQRKSSIPPALQANKLLLFKAMEDANKSVSHTKKKTQAVHVEPYEPTPISKLKKPVLRINSQEAMREMSISDAADIVTFEETMTEVEEGMAPTEDVYSKNIHVPVSSAKVPLMPVKRKLTRDPVVAQSEVVARNPRFVVTLDGVDPSEFLSPKSLRSVVSQRGTMAEESDLNEEEEQDDYTLQYAETMEADTMDVEMEEDIPAKKAKLQVRCLKWPACPHGDDCHFHHPKTHCKMFPNCSFGVKCLFIHPNCKYDSFCKKSDCPYTHAGKRKPANVKSEMAPVTLNVVCKFHPDCLNPSCTFFHPKNCKFGLQCKNPGCQFTHPVTSVASPHQLKWTAPKSSTSNRKFSLDTLDHMPIHIDK